MHEQEVYEDMYWAARDADGLGEDVIMLSTALRFYPDLAI